MNLIEAVKSGKPFRKKGTEIWLVVEGNIICKLDTKDELLNPFELCLVSEIVGDYEVREKTIFITRSIFWDAVQDSCNKSGVKLGAELRLSYAGIELLAKKLGLE